jgi:hypothetical protein
LQAYQREQRRPGERRRSACSGAGSIQIRRYRACSFHALWHPVHDFHLHYLKVQQKYNYAVGLGEEEGTAWRMPGSPLIETAS